nr:MAG TPA: Putative modification methylase [Caudoviricetes sp.]
MKKYKNIIEHLGKFYKTNTDIVKITDEELNNIKEKFFEKPNDELVFKQFDALKSGLVKNNYVNSKYFFELMCDVKLHHCKWSINEIFSSKEIIGLFLSRINQNKKVFNKDLITNLKTALRIGGKAVAQKPSDFPLKTANMILKKYNVNNRYYDFSCGWGVRLTSALINNIDYYGTDPNFLLVNKLNEFKNDWCDYFNQTTNVDIKYQGSEIFVPEWENKMGLAFSSPPYYNLEDYKHGNQSYNENVSYNDWLENYLKPTFMNVYRYLINDGYLVLNINNFKNYDLVGDSSNIINQIGFKYVGNEKLINNKRNNSLNKPNDNSEKCFVFQKK